MQTTMPARAPMGDCSEGTGYRHCLLSFFSTHMLRFSLRSFATSSSPRPWFVDPAFEHPRTPSSTASEPVAPVPHDAPPPVKLVHEALSRSPHLDLTTLVSRQTVDPRPGPPLPRRGPQGRRQRGATYAGESSFEVPGGIWRWTVMAQVRKLSCSGSTTYSLGV